MRVRATLAMLLIHVPGIAIACSVCFSADEGRKSAYVAVTLALLALTFGGVAIGALWIRSLERRRAELDSPPE